MFVIGSYANNGDFVFGSNARSGGTWQVTTSEIRSYGQQWSLFLTTACKSTLNSTLAKALDIYAKTGKALQGWNDNVNKDAAYEFYTRFLPLLGNNYTVYNAMVVARNGTRDAGYTCNPGFYGDLNYIGNSW